MRKILFALLLCITLSGFAQENIPIETWRTHAAYRSVRQLVLADEKVYGATDGGVFYFDRKENVLEKLTRLNGMSEVEVTAIAWHTERKILAIGYENGNIDLINAKGNISNIKTIKDSQLRGSKSFSDILFFGENAFFSSPQGITVINLDRNSVTENYFELGDQGSQLGVEEGVVFNDSLFIATSEGLLAAPLTGDVNLMDFYNWKRFTSTDGAPSSEVVSITRHKEEIYIVDKQNNIFVYNGSSWATVAYSGEALIKKIVSSNGRLFAVSETSVFEIADDFSFLKITSELIVSPSDVQIDENNVLWISDLKNGMISNVESAFKNYFPDGPFNNKLKKLYSSNGRTYGLVMSKDTDSDELQQSGFSVFEKGHWSNFSSSGIAGTVAIPAAKNIVDVVRDPLQEKIWFGSMGSGLLTWNRDGAFELIDENTPGTTLQPANLGQHAAVSAVATLGDGNVWLLNYGSGYPIQKVDQEGKWQSWQFVSAAHTTDLFVSDINDKWLLIDPQFGGKILVFNEETNEYRFLSTTTGEGGLPSNVVTDVAFGTDGQVWIGTDRGIAVLNSSNVIGQGAIDAYFPLYDGFELFNDQVIRCISVDGGNRKWIGTDKGAWLFGPGGDTLIYHFNIANSPMPSDVVVDITVEETSGEVFVATDNGLVSFRSTASKGNLYHQKVKVFPNPVRNDFTGKVGISGLAENSLVKITDISGKLIRQMRSEGGTATWDVADYKGRRAATGIYMIFSSTASGEDSYVGKIAVIK